MNLGTLDRRLLGAAAIGFFVVAALTGCGRLMLRDTRPKARS